MYGQHPTFRYDLNGLSNEFISSFCVADFRGNQRNFSAQLYGAQTGPLSVFRYDGHGLRGGVRSLRHIRANPTDDFVIILPLNFSHRVVQGGNEVIVKPGSFTLISTLKPFESYCGEPPHYFLTEFVIKIPGSLLRKRIPLVDKCCGVPFPGHRSMARIMQSMIQSILDEGDQLTSAQAEGLGTVLLDTMCLAAQDSPYLAALMDSLKQNPRDQIRQKAQKFVECRLSDPNLDIAMIADHCGVSRGHLHSVFAASPMTVGAFVREMRLQRCREDLRNPLLRNQSIIQIVMRWGYTSSVIFTRAYRARFGKSPSEERNAALQHS